MGKRIPPIVCCCLAFSLGCATPTSWKPTSPVACPVEAITASLEAPVPALSPPVNGTPSASLTDVDLATPTFDTLMLERLAESRPTKGSSTALALTGFQPMSSGQATSPDESDRDKMTVPAGVGFTAGPSTFLFGGSIDFPVDDHLTAGPALHLGFSGDNTLFAAFGQVRYWLEVSDDKEQKFRPFVQGGFGAVHLHKDGRGSDWGPLLNIGAGARLKTGSFWRLGSTFLFNFVPGDVVGDSFYISWEVIQVVLLI